VARTVLIVDDEASVRFPLSRFLAGQGFEVREEESLEGAVRSCMDFKPDAAIVDFSLPDGTGIDLLRRLKAEDIFVPTIVLTGHGTIELAVQAMQEGAEQFFTKPVELPTLLVILQRVLENQRNRQATQVRKSAVARKAVDPFIGKTEGVRQLADRARRVLSSGLPILIQGGTGTGKGVLARWLHDHGARADEPFVDLNCAGLSRDLLESELFGHEKGAFTGAVASKPGLLEMANRGTLFLDEIGDVDLQVQAKLLKVVEDLRYRRLGDVRDRQADVRLIAATHRDLSKLVQEQKFREDLFYRLNAIPLVMPSLHERRADIPAIAQLLVERIAGELGRFGVSLSKGALDFLASQPWPGNVRELRNTLERAVLLSEKAVLDERDFADVRPSLGSAAVAPPGPAAVADASRTLRDVERAHIESVLNAENGNVQRSAAVLGISRSALYEKVRRLGLTIATR